MHKGILLVIGVMVALHGCSLAPRYEKPGMPVPAAWPKGAAYDQSQAVAGATDALNLSWQTVYTDERLRKVIETALENNRDLRVAVLNIQRARGFYGVQRGELLPTLNASAGGRKQRLAGSSFGGDESTVSVEQYNVDLGISAWEIDFFGRLRSLKDQALEEYLATEEARRGAQISLILDIADTYLNLAANRENLNLAKTTLESQQRAYNLIQQRYQVGIATELDLRRAQTQVDGARVDVSRYTQQAELDVNALNLLVGSTSPVPEEWLPADLGNVQPPKDISPGLSSEILLSRPDILAAEHQLKAAYANIGAARASLFPRISLTTSLGTASGELSGLFGSGTETWSFAPQIVMPIFDSRLWSAMDVSKADREIALAQYEKAIQTAFREVADALAVQATLDDQIEAQQSLVDAFARTYDLSNTRYTKGIDNYLSVLDAQRSLYAAQQNLVLLHQSELTNQVRLYAVLGGGSN